MTASTGSAGGGEAPSVRSLVALLVLFVTTVTALVVLYVATPVASRPDVWNLLAVSGPSLILAVPVLFAYIGLKRSNTVQTEHLATIKEQTNGVLDKRIRDGVKAVLDAAGVTDHPDAPDEAPVPTQSHPTIG